jgi:hypothetical protein
MRRRLRLRPQQPRGPHPLRTSSTRGKANPWPPPTFVEALALSPKEMMPSGLDANGKSSPAMLNPAEQNDFAIVLANARAEGWLAADHDIAVDATTEAVVVTCKRGSEMQRKQYMRDPRWPYLFLRDLAQGVWVRSEPRPRYRPRMKSRRRDGLR